MHKDSLFFKLLRLGVETDALPVQNEQMDGKLGLDVDFAVLQGVGACIFDGLQKAVEFGVMASDSVSRDLKMKLFSHTMQVENVYRKHEEIISKLSGFYAKHGIRMMLLKGYGLSLLYPQPNHRPCGDVDIWLYGKQRQGDELLSRERNVRIEKDHNLHTVFHIDGVMVENHYEFFNSQSHISNREIERELMNKGGELSHGDKVCVLGCEVYLPSPDFNALFLLRHAASHFAAAEIALRHVTDWAMFVKRYHKDIDWIWLERVAKEQSMHRFLHCLNGICIDYIGLNADMFPDFKRDEPLEARIMEDILNPRFFEKSALHSDFFTDYTYRFRRWWEQRWKHKLVYKEGLTKSFLIQIRSHLMTPKIRC